jgi:hypothetical protein
MFKDMIKDLKRIIKGLICLYGNTERIIEQLKYLRFIQYFFWVQIGIIIIIILWLLLLTKIIVK